MRRFVLGWKHRGCDQRYGAQIVNYADDLVICCKGNANQALQEMREIMGRLKLTVNEGKTHVHSVPAEQFDFLGYTFGRCFSAKTGRAYLGSRPSKKSTKRLIESIHEQTEYRRCLLPADDVVKQLNRSLRGWGNYFKLGPVSKAYAAIDAYTVGRLRRWLCHKHKVRGSGRTRYPDGHLYEKMGLVQLSKTTRNLPWAKA
jgi:hypothetical protein